MNHFQPLLGTYGKLYANGVEWSAFRSSKQVLSQHTKTSKCRAN